jgi:hypothetical protein
VELITLTEHDFQDALKITEALEYRLCGQVVRVPDYRYRSILGATRFSEK